MRALLICPGPPVAGSGTKRASSQSLPPFEDHLILFRKGTENADVRVWRCFHVCADHSGAPSRGTSSPSVFGETPNIGHCPLLVASEPPRGRHQARARASASCKSGNFKNQHAVTHSCWRPFISAPSNDCVPVFGRKMGLCAAQRSESLKAACQIQPLWSALVWLASLQFLQVVSNSISPEPRQPRLDL